MAKCIICGFETSMLDKIIEHFLYKDNWHREIFSHYAIEGFKKNDLSGNMNFLIDAKNYDLVHQ